MSNENLSTGQLDTVGDVGIIDIPTPKIRTEKIDIDSKQIEYDYMSDVKDVVSEAQETKDSGLEITPYENDVGIVDRKAWAALGLIDRLLSEAKALIDQKKYKDAVDTLDNLLKEDPNHHEGIYLMAYCYVKMPTPENDLRALRILFPLRNVRLERGIESRIRVLKLQIRNRVILTIIIEALLQGKTKTKTVIPRLRELSELDPDNSVYHFMLAISYLKENQAKEALDALNRGMVEVSEKDQSRLKALKNHIERQYLVKLLQVAVQSLRSGDIKKARDLVANIDKSYHHLRLFIIFNKYTKKISGLFGQIKKHKAVSYVSSLDPLEQDNLNFLLAGDAVKMGAVYFKKEKFGRAEAELSKAIEYTAYFPYAHFLLAATIYHNIGRQLVAKKLSSIDDALNSLRTAEAHARVGAKDPQIKEASQLLSLIQDLIKAFEKNNEQRKRIEAEAKPLNKAIETFNDIMKTAEKGISSVTQLHQVRTRMEQLSKELPKIKKVVISDRGKEIFQKLEETVDRNLKQLDGIRKKFDEQAIHNIVNQHVAEFNDAMKKIEQSGGIKSKKELEKNVKLFVELGAKVQKDRDKYNNPQLIKRLDELMEAIRNVLLQLADIMKKIG